MSTPQSTSTQTIRLFLQASRQADRRLVILSAFYPLGAVLLSTLAPLFIGKTLAAIGHGSSSTHYLIYFGIAGFAGFLCNRYGFKAFLCYQAQVMRYLQELSFSTLLKRGMKFHNNNIGGKLVSDAIDLAVGFMQFFNAIVNSVVPLIITLFAGSIIIFIESWKLGLIIVLMTALTVGSGIYDSKRRSGWRKQRMIVTKELTGHLADTILNVQTVKTFARENNEITTHRSHGRELERLRFQDWGQSAINGSNRIALLLALQALFVVVVVHLIQHDPALLGIGIFAFSFTVTLSNRLFDINAMIRGIEDGLLLAAPMVEILAEDNEITDAPKASPLRVTKGGITLQNVSFAYREDGLEQTVFSHLNLVIKPGEKIGLVGPSGGGKSTLTRLLLRFEDVTGGKIAIDGQNIATVTQASLRSAMSYVPQEPLLFHRSVQENIAYGQPNATFQQIQAAAKLAHADEFIDTLKDGYDTVVGERGVKLSGGQRQRIAIARAILRDTPILLLDEATSALDSESEVLIQDALQDLMQKRTAIVIAHRLSTIQKMDRILVLDNGAVVEEGSHRQLLRAKGLYAKLWAHQSGGFMED